MAPSVIPFSYVSSALCRIIIPSCPSSSLPRPVFPEKLGYSCVTPDSRSVQRCVAVIDVRVDIRTLGKEPPYLLDLTSSDSIANRVCDGCGTGKEPRVTSIPIRHRFFMRIPGESAVHRESEPFWKCSFSSLPRKTRVFRDTGP